MNRNKTVVHSNKKTVVNSNKTIGNSILAITEASVAKSGKNVMGFVESKPLLLTVLSTAIDLLLTVNSNFTIPGYDVRSANDNGGSKAVTIKPQQICQFSSGMGH